MDYQSASDKSRVVFSQFRLSVMDNFNEFIKSMHEELINFYDKTKVSEIVNLNNQNIALHKSIRDYRYNTEYQLEHFYHQKGELHRYKTKLKKPNLERYFGNSDVALKYNNYQITGLIEHTNNLILKYNNEHVTEANIKGIKEIDGYIEIYATNFPYDFIDYINNGIRDFYAMREMHVTRMFGSYILLVREYAELKAVAATPVPIKYCPLMAKLLHEVAGDYADELLETIKTEDIQKQTKYMCKLINETVIKSGYFDTKRPLNSCEANVLFGASETMASALKNDLIDAAVIVSNNLGTIIATDESNTQGAVKRMTGLFYTTPNEEIINTAYESGIIPVFPYTGEINQLAGVKEAIKHGYRKIAVSVAADDNYLLEEIKKLETDKIKIYKFGLCSTGISKKTAQIMLENADVIWSCASKYVKELIEPNAIAQVGVKIPVHIMSNDGYKIITNHLNEMGYSNRDISLQKGDDKPVFLNQDGEIKQVTRKKIKECSNCPYPCI